MANLIKIYYCDINFEKEWIPGDVIIKSKLKNKVYITNRQVLDISIVNIKICIGDME